ALGALPLEPQPRAVFGPGRNSDRETLLLTDLARPSASGAALRGHLAAPAAHGARPLHGETALAERDGPAPPALGAGRERRPPPTPRRPPPPNAPYRRSRPSFFRFAASLSPSCASLSSLKRSAACGFLGLRSGWYCLARRRNAFLISSVVAASDTPRIW